MRLLKIVYIDFQQLYLMMRKRLISKAKKRSGKGCHKKAKRKGKGYAKKEGTILSEEDKEDKLNKIKWRCF